MNAIALSSRWHTTFRKMQAAVQAPQRPLPLGKPALWIRLLRFGWVVYRATNLRRTRGMPGMAFDAIVAALCLVFGTANLLV